MKFFAIVAFFMTYKGVVHHFESPYVEPYDTRAACVADVLANYAEEYRDEEKGFVTALDPALGFACISTDGEDQKFPIREKIAEGWDRA